MKIKNSYLLTSMIAAAIFVCSITYIIYAQEKLKDVGIKFKNSTSLNNKIADIIMYIGTCPGNKRENIIGRFRNEEIPTLKGRRVRIFNETLRGIADKVPYTDHKYKKKGRSQKIRFDFGINHKKSKFIIKRGLNKLSYLIYDGKHGKSNMKAIKEGKFSIKVQENPNIKIYQRDIQWESKAVCLDKYGNVKRGETLDKCKIVGTERVGSCEGKTVYRDLNSVYKKP